MSAPIDTEREMLAAVVVTHDRPEQLELTVQRLLSSSPAELGAIVVVDNASGPETRVVLDRLRTPRLHVVRSEDNVGGAGGFALGMEYAVERLNAGWVVVMDDDARPDLGALQTFWDRQPDDSQAVAAAVRYPDGSICEMNRPSVNPFWHATKFLSSLLGLFTGRLRDGYHIPKSAYAESVRIPVDLSSFVGLFVSGRMIRDVGLPDAGLFLYGDDVIYTLGLRRIGYDILFDPEIRFEHDCSTFRDDQARVYSPIWKVYYTYRNGLIMYRSAAGGLFWFMVPLLLFKWTTAGKRYGRDKSAYKRLMRRAVRDGLRRDTSMSHDDVLDLARQS